VALADGEVVGVVRGRYLDGAGAELGLRPVVGEDGNLARRSSRNTAEGQRDQLADEGLVAFVVRINRYGNVAEHGLGPRGGDDNRPAAVGERIADVVELAQAVLVRDFEVGDGGLDLRVPVDDVGAAIDQPLLVEANEGFAHGDVEAVVHGEVFARPIDGGAQAAHLVGDGGAVLALPRPYAFGEDFAAEGFAVGAFDFQLAFDQHLRGDAGVVGAGNPDGGVAAHAPPAHQDVRLGVLEHVAHVQVAGDVGRRQQHSERYRT
jgi:hypothetical protein